MKTSIQRTVAALASSSILATGMAHATPMNYDFSRATPDMSITAQDEEAAAPFFGLRRVQSSDSGGFLDGGSLPIDGVSPGSSSGGDAVPSGADVAVVPLPAAGLTMGLGMLALASLRRRRKP